MMKGLPVDMDPEGMCLWLAACAEQQSEHPLARAIVDAAKFRWGEDATHAKKGVVVRNFEVVTGRGVECEVSHPTWGDYEVRVGSFAWTSGGLSDDGSEWNVATDEARSLRERGQVVIYVSVLNKSSISGKRDAVGVFGLKDPIKEDSASTIRALQNLGIEVWMCTGDHKVTAEAVASELGISLGNVFSQATPEEKASLVTRVQMSNSGVSGGSPSSRKKIVAAVGDGTNDSVMIRKADVGIAIGAGTEVAVEAADVVLVRSSISDVLVAVHLSRVVFRRIIYNFIWAMGYNLITLPFAAGVLYPITDFRLPPEFAGLMMAFSSVSVVTSSLLLRRYKAPDLSVKCRKHEEGIFRLLCCKKEVAASPVTQYEMVALGETV